MLFLTENIALRLPTRSDGHMVDSWSSFNDVLHSEFDCFSGTALSRAVASASSRAIVVSVQGCEMANVEQQTNTII